MNDLLKIEQQRNIDVKNDYKKEWLKIRKNIVEKTKRGIYQLKWIFPLINPNYIGKNWNYHGPILYTLKKLDIPEMITKYEKPNVLYIKWDKTKKMINKTRSNEYYSKRILKYQKRSQKRQLKSKEKL